MPVAEAWAEQDAWLTDDDFVAAVPGSGLRHLAVMDGADTTLQLPVERVLRPARAGDPHPPHEPVRTRWQGAVLNGDLPGSTRYERDPPGRGRFSILSFVHRGPAGSGITQGGDDAPWAEEVCS